MNTRTYLMCRPTYFAVEYAINAWMDTSVPVDPELAVRQWEALKQAYETLGHTVEVLDPEPGLLDMVFSANGAFSVGGKVYGARFAFPERRLEAGAHERWYCHHGWDYTPAAATNEGEGDFTFVPGRGIALAGYGFRTEPAAHAEAQDVLGVPVVGLHLVDPRFYHLDVALFVLDDNNVCFYPGAFSEGSQHVLHHLFPDAIIATEADALAFGLNAVSDGTNVVIAAEAVELADRLRRSGFSVVPVELSELMKSGGNAKCCTAELRR